MIAANVRDAERLGRTFTDTKQMFLILLAAFIYRATVYGFGMRVVGIKAISGNLTKAMKVRRVRSFE